MGFEICFFKNDLFHYSSLCFELFFNIIHSLISEWSISFKNLFDKIQDKNHSYNTCFISNLGSLECCKHVKTMENTTANKQKAE